jgi:hypothetical protein
LNYPGPSADADVQKPAEPKVNASSVLDEADVLVCFCQLRWRFVFQRPQHLMVRFARRLPVYFVEEPIADTDGSSFLEVAAAEQTGITIVTAHVPNGTPLVESIGIQRRLLRGFWRERGIHRAIRWIYTPMMVELANDLASVATVYDCMDELSAFKGASAALVERERYLLEKADVVFTGGRSLYQAKLGRHPRVHLFPSSIDGDHFRKARKIRHEPEDQAHIPHPRLGHYAVLDERLDADLVAAIADARPDWHIVLVGPVVKIDPASLPKRPNIHYLGSKPYEALPAYLAGWDVAIMPFAINDSTRFISPTKTPEYLAAGRRVVSTPVPDVVADYGRTGLVSVAATPDAFVAAVDAALASKADRAAWLSTVDRALARTSWDNTWTGMVEVLND